MGVCPGNVVCLNELLKGVLDLGRASGACRRVRLQEGKELAL